MQNNVMGICFGSGIFVEDGTEIDNVIDHNLGFAADSRAARRRIEFLRYLARYLP